MPRKARLRVALYARVSTKDKDQNPDTQLYRLRDFVGVHPDWAIRQEYIDRASASDLGHRTAWSSLMADAMQKRFDAVAVFKLDRAFRSVLHMHQTLAQWDPLGIGFLSAQEGFDTTTATGRLLMNILGSLAEFELEMIRERVIAGMDRAKRQGKRLGRPSKGHMPFVQAKWPTVCAQLTAGTLGVREAAQYLGVSPSWVSRHWAVAKRESGEEARKPVSDGSRKNG